MRRAMDLHLTPPAETTPTEAALLAAIRPSLIALFRRRVRPAWRAEDLCHDAMQIALHALRENRLKDRRRLNAYVWGIAERLIQESWRLQARSPDPLADALEPKDPAQGPEEKVLAAEKRARVHAVLRALRGRDRELLEAVFLREAEKEHVCRALSLSPAAFDVVKWRALRRFARVWKSLGHGRARRRGRAA